MADPQALAAALIGPQPNMMGSFAPQPGAQMGPIAQPAQPSAYDQYQAQMQMMRAKQAQQQNPRNFIREINPGATWGGQDRNAMQPNDAMQSRFYAQAPENT